MRQLPLLAMFVFAAACTKKDVQLINQHINKNKCSVVSINAGKQNTNNFYVVKTFDNNNILTHIKMQVNDAQDIHYQFDYAITYSQDRAVFKGSTKAFYWVPDTPPEDPDAPEDPNVPKHPEEVIEMRETRDFEILFDRRTHYPVEVRYIPGGESALKLEYNNRGYLNKVGHFDVTTDNRGNILSILTPPLVEEEPYYGPQQLGVWYTYSDRNVARNTNQFYETPTMFISPMFSLLELLNLGPFQPDRERVHTTLQLSYAEEYLPSPYMEASYSDHQYDSRGNLIKYDFEGDVRRDLPYKGTVVRTDTRSITWQCSTGNGGKPFTPGK